MKACVVLRKLIAIQISVCCFSKLIWYLVFNFPSLYHTVLKHTALSQGAGDYSKFNQRTSHIKRHLLLGRKVMINLDSILKARHYFANKGPSSHGYGFSSSHIWMWELDYKESWARKNWCFWTVWCWRRLKSNQSILKEISSEYSLEGLMLKFQ